uniref:Uncharacterized protein n=1 Tax=Rhizophora mucronata TaxID=61149 RepID=A0A2P2PMB1_RHIMU
MSRNSLVLPLGVTRLTDWHLLCAIEI